MGTRVYDLSQVLETVELSRIVESLNSNYLIMQHNFGAAGHKDTLGLPVAGH